MFRNCLSPVTSYGIIAVRYPDHAHQRALFSPMTTLPSFLSPVSPSFQFLFIRRKDSLSFIEFIRGKFSYQDEAYIGKLLENMTQEEQHRLLHSRFDEIWHHIWGESSSVKSHRNNYEMAEKRFTMLAPHLPRLVEQHPSPWMEPEWGFPKGRRNPHESDMNCAIREFQEETGLKRNEFFLLQNTQSISETFFGSNHVHYCHKYYLAICPPRTNVSLQEQHPHMFREIGDIRWFTLEEAMAKIRPDNVEKREILLKAGNILKNFYPIVFFEPPGFSQPAAPSV